MSDSIVSLEKYLLVAIEDKKKQIVDLTKTADEARAAYMLNTGAAQQAKEELKKLREDLDKVPPTPPHKDDNINAKDEFQISPPTMSFEDVKAWLAETSSQAIKAKAADEALIPPEKITPSAIAQFGTFRKDSSAEYDKHPPKSWPAMSFEDKSEETYPVPRGPDGKPLDIVRVD